MIRFGLDDKLEIEAEAKFEAYLGALGELIEGHAVINSRLNGQILVEEEGVANLRGEKEIIGTYIGALSVLISTADAQIKAILLNVEAATQAHFEGIVLITMIVTEVGQHQHIVCQETTGCRSQIAIKFGLFTVAHAQIRSRDTNIRFARLELRIGGQGGEDHYKS